MSEALSGPVRSDLVTEEEAADLLEQCRAVITESLFALRMERIRCMWCVGQAIATHPAYERLMGGGPGRHSVIQWLARELPIGQSEIYSAVQFYREWPDLQLDLTPDGLMRLPGGKDLSWNQVKRKLLPGKSDEEARVIPWSVRRDRVEQRSQRQVGRVWTIEDHYAIMASIRGLEA